MIRAAKVPGLIYILTAGDNPINDSDPSGLRPRPAASAPPFYIVPGVPPGSVVFIAPDGHSFYAPRGTDFQQVYAPDRRMVGVAKAPPLDIMEHSIFKEMEV